MIIDVARVLSSVVVTDQLCHTRSFIGAYSSKSTVSVTVLVFLKIMAMERSRCRGGGADYKLHKTSSSICIGSRNSSKYSQGKSGNFVFEFEWEPCKMMRTLHKSGLLTPILFLTLRCMSFLLLAESLADSSIRSIIFYQFRCSS